MTSGIQVRKILGVKETTPLFNSVFKLKEGTLWVFGSSKSGELSDHWIDIWKKAGKAYSLFHNENTLISLELTLKKLDKDLNYHPHSKVSTLLFFIDKENQITILGNKHSLFHIVYKQDILHGFPDKYASTSEFYYCPTQDIFDISLITIENYPFRLALQEGKLKKIIFSPKNLDFKVNQVDKWLSLTPNRENTAAYFLEFNTKRKTMASKTSKQLITGSLIFILLATFLWFKLSSDGWKTSMKNLQHENDSLTFVNKQLLEKHNQLSRAFESQVNFIRQNKFDSYDSNNFRVYGLYRDKSQQETAATVAYKFHVSNINAIKVSNVLGERWFTVPVKGIHYVKKGETAKTLSKLYYGTSKHSETISNFNLVIADGHMIFIPYGPIE